MLHHRNRKPAGGVQVPKLCALVKRGIGLNTRTGCARFITALVLRQASDIKPHAPALIKVTSLSMYCLQSLPVSCALLRASFCPTDGSCSLAKAPCCCCHQGIPFLHILLIQVGQSLKNMACEDPGPKQVAACPSSPQCDAFVISHEASTLPLLVYYGSLHVWGGAELPSCFRCV